MALFKPMYGSNETALNAKNLVEGYCWFTTDDGKFYVDTKNSSGVLSRILLNAGKADQLATARTFQIADNDGTNKGPTVSFNGTSNIIINLPSTIKASISGSASSLQFPQALTTDELIDNFLSANTLQVALWNNTSSPGVTNGTIISSGWNNTTYGWQLAIDDDPTYYMALRQKSTTWGAWKRIPMGDGTGASGTWGISVSGNAATATKLATARTISLGDQLQGSASFNGSANITINAQLKNVSVSGNNTNTYLYRRFASGAPGTGQYSDYFGIFLIASNYHDGSWGIIKVAHRVNNTGTSCGMSAKWLVRDGFAENSISVASYGVSGDNVYFDVFFKCPASWPRITITSLGPTNLSLYSSSEGTDSSSPSEAYTTIANAGTALHGKAYTNIVASTQVGIYGAVWN